MRRLAHVCVLTSLVLVALAPLPVSTQARWNQPRTPWGDPDFSGVWNYATMTPFERPPEWVDKERLAPEEAAAYEQQIIGRRANANQTAGPDWWDPGTNVMKDLRTSLVVDPPDGRIPPLTPAAQKRMAGRGRGGAGRGGPEAPEQLGLNERCLSFPTTGPPMVPGVYNNNVQFLQGRPYLIIYTEMVHDARIVPMDGRPHGAIRRWMGDSRGHWEGSTLVVDTINFNGKVNFRGSSENLYLVERFTRTGDRTLDYRFTVDDPTTWTKPWTAAVPMTRIDARVYEFACHEGNFRSVVGMLNGTLVQQKLTERP